MKKDLCRWTAGIGLCGASLLAPAMAHASTMTGNVGVFSDYVFRGIVAEGGAAVQGGIDYYHDSGVFLGTWVSNSNPFGGNEWDLYGGFSHHFGNKLVADVGVLRYTFSEDNEIDGAPNLDTTEFFAGLTMGPAKAQVYYSDDYVGTDDEAWYYTALWTQPIRDTIAVALQVGYTEGDGAEAVYGDDYVDYSLTLNKTIREGLVFSLAVIDTNLKDEDGGAFVNAEDKPKFLVSVKQTFPF